VLFEANREPGGQVQIAARAPRRQEIIGITEWLYQQVKRLGVDVRLNHYAQAAEVMAEKPEVIIVATGGLPNTSFLPSGADLVVSSWDILSGYAKPAANVLFFDDHGNHESYSCVEFIAESGSTVELVTPDRMVAQEIGGTSYPAYLKIFYDRGVTLTLNHRLTAVHHQANKLVVTLYNEYNKSIIERVVDQVVVEHGSLPVADLYFELKDGSSNLGEVDIPALIAGRPQTLVNNPDGQYQLFRVGDAVSSRNIHAAIYDSLRLCKDL
jgi:NADPH-dependent 2,4-dienoyl-CoA reductase/sulfur reductase-like enzyme